MYLKKEDINVLHKNYNSLFARAEAISAASLTFILPSPFASPCGASVGSVVVIVVTAIVTLVVVSDTFVVEEVVSSPDISVPEMLVFVVTVVEVVGFAVVTAVVITAPFGYTVTLHFLYLLHCLEVLHLQGCHNQRMHNLLYL